MTSQLSGRGIYSHHGWMGRASSSSLRSHSLNTAWRCSGGSSRHRLHGRLQRCQAQQEQQTDSSSSAACTRRPIEVSRSIAAARAAESSLPDGLFTDPFAAQLFDTQQQQQQQQQKQQQEEALLDVIATRYIDESLLNAMAATNVNSIQSGDYRQVVIIGDGMDCRPFRLPWPPGTLLFLVAPPEVHGQAEALLAAAGQAEGQPQAHVMRGCLLRRVSMNLSAADTAAEPATGSSKGPGTDGSAAVPATIFSAQLARAGFRADRLSVWALQGLHGQGLGRQQLQALLSEVADCAAFHSLLVGEVPGPISKREAENLLAEAGLLGAVFSHEQESYSRWQQQQDLQESLQDSREQEGEAAGSGEDMAPRWLCTAQQLRLSLEQMGIYEDWSSEFADADAGDDFIGNFS